MASSPRRIHPTWTDWSLEMGPIDFPETSVINYQCKLRNIPEERRFLVHRGGSA